MWTLLFVLITGVCSVKQFTPLDIDNFPCSAKSLKKTTRYVCDNDGTVTCMRGWEKGQGEDPLHPCSKPICKDGCVNGECKAPDTCTCDVGWTGTNCTRCIPFPGCVNGGCHDKPLTCNCKAGYHGSLCDAPVCDCCMNGVCVSPQECSCHPGWSDAEGNCTVCLKHPGCKNGGCVNSQGVHIGNGCFCNAGWTGALCDIPHCTDGCVNGDCRALGNHPTCVCNLGWKGSNCSDCVPHPGCPGTCTTPWQCLCSPGSTNPLCTIVEPSETTYTLNGVLSFAGDAKFYQIDCNGNCQVTEFTFNDMSGGSLIVRVGPRRDSLLLASGCPLCICNSFNGPSPCSASNFTSYASSSFVVLVGALGAGTFQTIIRGTNFVNMTEV